MKLPELITKRFKKIMLVDDNVYDIKFHKRVLNNVSTDFQITEMFSCKDAFEFLEQNKTNIEQIPDVIFLDLNLPGMTGWDFLETLGHFIGFYKTPRIVILSVSENESDIRKSKSNCYVSDYVSKPLIQSTVARLLTQFNEEKPEFIIF